MKLKQVGEEIFFDFCITYFFSIFLYKVTVKFIFYLLFIKFYLHFIDLKLFHVKTICFITNIIVFIYCHNIFVSLFWSHTCSAHGFILAMCSEISFSRLWGPYEINTGIRTQIGHVQSKCPIYHTISLAHHIFLVQLFVFCEKFQQSF